MLLGAPLRTRKTGNIPTTLLDNYIIDNETLDNNQKTAAAYDDGDFVGGGGGGGGGDRNGLLLPGQGNQGQQQQRQRGRSISSCSLSSLESMVNKGTEEDQLSTDGR